MSLDSANAKGGFKAEVYNVVHKDFKSAFLIGAIQALYFNPNLANLELNLLTCPPESTIR